MTTKIRVKLEITVDLDAYAAEYGDEIGSRVDYRNDVVRSDLENLAVEAFDQATRHLRHAVIKAEVIS